jgi:WXXGXW repeat (2 copies)
MVGTASRFFSYAGCRKNGRNTPFSFESIYMETKIVDRCEARTSAERGTKTKGKSTGLLLVLLLFVTFGVVGCEEEHYGAYPGYGPNYVATGPYGPGYGPGPYGPRYVGPAGYPGSVSIEIGDRPYYTRGAGYYVGRSYYVWRPGHWTVRHGQRVWIHGHYVVRG